MSYLGSSFTSVPSRPWRSNGPWMSTGPVFAGGPTRSNRSLKHGHDVTVLADLPSARTGRRHAPSRSPCGTYSGACRPWAPDCPLVTSRALGGEAGQIGVKTLKPLGNGTCQIQSRKKGIVINIISFPSVSPLSPASYQARCVLESIPRPVWHKRSEKNLSYPQCTPPAQPSR